jgi:flagellar hook-length control protein FliK
MTAQLLPSAPTNATPFDLPLIPSASQIDQQALPFSQLLQQVQAPASTPTTAAPPSAPPILHTSNSTTTTTTIDGNDRSAKKNPDSSPSQTNAAHDDTTSTAGKAPSAVDAASGKGTNVRQPGSDDQHGKVALHTAAIGPQPKSLAKKGADDSAKHRNDEAATPSATAAAATVVAPQPVSQNNDRGKSSKGAANSAPTKETADDQNDGGTVSPAASAQVVANTVTTLAAGDSPAVAKSKNGKDGTNAKVVAGAKQVATEAGTAQVPQQTSPAQLGSKPSASAPSPGDTSSLPARTPLSAKNGALSTAAVGDASKSSKVPTVTTQSDALIGATPGDASPPSSAVQEAAAVTASGPQVVSTITVDQSAVAATATPNGNNTLPATTTSAAPNISPQAAPSVYATPISQSAPQGTSVNPSLNTADRARFIQRVARAFQTAGDQGGQMRLRLSPPELGSLQMQISLKQGALTAHIQADNSTAQQALLDSLPDLRDRLAQQNIRVERFEVELTGQSSGGLSQSPQGKPDFAQAGRRSSMGAAAPASANLTEHEQSVRSAPVLTSGALNVVV